MDICAISAVDKRLLAKKVGDDLVKRHGRKPYHAVGDIKAAARRARFPDAWDCWALSLYASPQDFADYHRQTGERCDYRSMHDSMAEAVALDGPVADAASTDLPALPGSTHDGPSSNDASWFDGLRDLIAGADHPFDTDTGP
ncbi:MAG TPA: hypothetical protein VFS55_08360 [Dokdonella sp.]|nr:hypothetical protein [Dokdonella sp.]